MGHVVRICMLLGLPISHFGTPKLFWVVNLILAYGSLTFFRNKHFPPTTLSFSLQLDIVISLPTDTQVTLFPLSRISKSHEVGARERRLHNGNGERDK